MTDTWEQVLKSGLGDPARSWTYDIDDRPEISMLGTDSRLKTCLLFIESSLHVTLRQADDEAMRLQRLRKIVAMLAIWPGIFAVALAVTQLALVSVSTKWTHMFGAVEVVAVVIAASAIMVGSLTRLHDRWLSQRQITERLRSTKFQSLGWPEFWTCETTASEAWKNRLKTEVERIKNTTGQSAESWAELDYTGPLFQNFSDCDVNAKELSAVVEFYRFKRLQFQLEYFDRQSKSAHSGSWAARWKVSLIAFIFSVVMVFLHVVLSFNNSQASHDEQVSSTSHFMELAAVALAALSPILAFGLRAWTGAFEFPRSRNLYRAKAHALKREIDALNADRTDLTKVMDHIATCEHFFLGEHREWCRLQLESEWYV